MKLVLSESMLLSHTTLHRKSTLNVFSVRALQRTFSPLQPSKIALARWIIQWKPSRNFNSRATEKVNDSNGTWIRCTSNAVYFEKTPSKHWRLKYSVIWWRHYVIPWYANSITYARDCFPRHGRLVGLTRSRCLSFNRALGYLQRVSGPQIFRESRRRIEDTTESKKEKKKMRNKFCVLELKQLILNNHYLNQLVPFPMYCIYMCTKKIVIERTRDLIYLKFVETDFFPKIISPSAGENFGRSF